MAIRVLVVDDVEEIRLVVGQALRLRGGFSVVGEAGDGRGAIAAAGDLQPDIVVLDLGLPDLTGRDLVTALRAAAPGAQIVVFTGAEPKERGIERDEVEGFVAKAQDVSYLVDLLEDLSRRSFQTAVFSMSPDPSEVAAARHFIAQRCAEWNCGSAIDDALVVVSELVTNAVVHAGTRCELHARITDRILRLEVVDAGSGAPDPQQAGSEDERGRGLLLVSALCAAWGVESQPDGRKVVWAELLLPATSSIT